MATARCTWTAVSGVDGYNVYLKSNGTFVKQNSELITDTVYDIENLEDGNYEAYATSVLNDVESDASNVKGFELGESPLYPYTNNFSQYSINESPSDITVKYGSGATMKVVEDTDALNGRALEFLHPQHTNHYVFILDALREETLPTNCKVIVRYKRTGSGSVSLKLVGRSRVGQVDLDGFTTEIHSNHGSFRHRIWVAGVDTVLSAVEQSVPEDAYVFISLVFDGTSMETRYWTGNEGDEPASALVTDSGPAITEQAGDVGFGGFTGFDYTITHYIDYIKVENNDP